MLASLPNRNSLSLPGSARLPKPQVFAHLILCFETAAADGRFVGINMVMPEDGYYSMHDYSEHMRMVGFLHQLYPKVRITLHAGEIASPLVTHEGLCCHIRLAVEQAGAERIGHGVDAMWEDHPHRLLHEMADRHAPPFCVGLCPRNVFARRDSHRQL